MTDKKCFKCSATKPVDHFYRHPGMADGRLGKCIECTKIDVRANRLAKIDYYREYDAQRNSKPHRILAHKRYSATEAGRLSMRKAKKRYADHNLIKRAAHIMLRNAVRDGRIEKPGECSECGSGGRIHGHHDDYAFPLSVRWLCSKCHTQWHKHNESING